MLKGRVGLEGFLILGLMGGTFVGLGRVCSFSTLKKGATSTEVAQIQQLQFS